jgi:16S rRNA (guanine527-N7)-methyltransferase
MMPPAPFADALAPDALARFDAYLALLLKWNARTNLTAIRDPQTIVQRHFAESVFAARHVPAEAATLLDYGSGAGFPGIPIAISRPTLAVTLAESQNKKAAFLREAVRTLGLRAEVWDKRVEDLPAARVFDCITLRAVDKMDQACAAASGRLAPGGVLVVFTTRKLEPSLASLSGLAWQPAEPVLGSSHGILKVGTLA